MEDYGVESETLEVSGGLRAGGMGGGLQIFPTGWSAQESIQLVRPSGRVEWDVTRFNPSNVRFTPLNANQEDQ